MPNPKLVAFSGSIRKSSFNSAILKAAANAATSAGADVALLDLRDYDLPLFNQDLEDASGLPEAAKKLKAKFREADGFILASPEYNSAFSALMKNTIDWCSRAETDDEPPLTAYAGKSALLLSASPGALGGLRGLYSLRTLLQNIQVSVYPEMLAVRSAHQIIGPDGNITDAQWAGKIKNLAESYALFAARLAGKS